MAASAAPNANKCWGTVKFEDKAGPVLNCAIATDGPYLRLIQPVTPDSFKTFYANYFGTFALFEKSTGLFSGSIVPTYQASCAYAVPLFKPTVTDCSAIASLTYVDVTLLEGCPVSIAQFGNASKLIKRTWTAVDIYGNSSTCEQQIALLKSYAFINGGLIYPAAYTKSLCNYTTNAAGQIIEALPELTDYPRWDGVPLVAGSLAVTVCNFTAAYTDKTSITTCGVKVVRTWVTIDFCTGNVLTTGTGTNPQIITLEDKTAPTFTGIPAPITISTGNTTCVSDALVAPPTATDNCTRPLTYSVTIGTSTFSVIAGKARILGLASGTYVATWKAIDPCGNIGTKTQSITVKDLVAPTAVCNTDTKVSLSQDCEATVNAIIFDDGSNDNCCLSAAGFRVARMIKVDSFGVFAKTITFTKADLGKNIMVGLQVADCNGNTNICMVNVLVEDKIAPIIFGRDTIVCCGSTPTATAWLNTYTLPLKSTSDFPSAANPGYYDNCGSKLTFTQSGTIDNCGNGTRTKLFTATDNQNAMTATTTVRYISENRSAYMVEFPNDKEITCVTGNTNSTYATTPAATGVPIVTNFAGTCPLVGVEFKDEVFNIQNTNQGCFKIVRTWKVLNWCQPLPGNLAVVKGSGTSKATDPKTTVVRTGTQAVFRKFYNIDLLRPDRISSVLAPGAPCLDLMTAAVTDYPAGFDTDGYMEYTQIIKVIDTTIPSLTKGAVALEAIGKECRVKLSVEKPTADDCTGIVSTSYQLVNAANVIVGGTTFGGTHTTNFGGTGELPFGKYIVRYLANDNCGNFASTDVAIDVKDVKKPTPVCFQGLSVDLMPTVGTVMIPCSILDAGSYDNCSGTECFVQTPAPGPGKVAPAAADVDATAGGMTTSATPTKLAKNILFSCVGIQTVALWIRDASGNWDYCETYVDVQNNMGATGVPACPPTGAVGPKVAVAVKTEAGNPAKAQVSVLADGFATPIKKWTQITGTIDGLPVALGSKVEISAENNLNPLNGVSTLDLVQISKHILGTQTINSKYAKIAADVNNNGSISTADLVELRKMILGINTNFANNTSWKFFTANMSEKAIIADFQADATIDFTAVKIGDINGNADATLAAGRSIVNFNVADANVAAGEEVKVVMNNKEVEGFQFAMNYDAASLEVVSIDENSAVLENGTITTAQVGTDFAVTFKAKKNVTLSNAISLGSAINGEAVVNGTSANVAINFNNTVTGFELAQNQPNPFRGATVVSFTTPVAGEYTLTITDMAGRTVQSSTANAVKGTNNVTVEMTSAGVFNYTVKTANFTATKKMVVIE